MIADPVPLQLHGDTLLSALSRAELKYSIVEVPSGEAAKTINSSTRVFDELLDLECARRTPLVAFGGGSVTDMVGFVAATYMRGVPLIQIPTTLLSQLDAAVGGKAGVNHPRGKNLIGSFYSPVGVLCDLMFLSTLDRRDVSSGLAEAVKVAILSSAELFDLVQKASNLPNVVNSEEIVDIVCLAIRKKLDLLTPDPFELDLSRHLNFGHETAHALETSKQYHGLRHGEAVSVGMAIATRLALSRGLCSRSTTLQIVNLLDRLRLPITLDRASADDVWDCMSVVRLIRGDALRFVLPRAIGTSEIVNDVSRVEFMSAIAR